MNWLFELHKTQHSSAGSRVSTPPRCSGFSPAPRPTHLRSAPGRKTLSTLPGIAPDRLTLPALAYAVTYPTAIVGIIGTLLLLKLIFRIEPAQEAADFAAKNRRKTDPLDAARSSSQIRTSTASASTPFQAASKRASPFPASVTRAFGW